MELDKLIEGKSICVIGLGYVGLPLALEFSHKFKVIGYDISVDRIDKLRRGIDETLEVDENVLKNSVSNNSLVLTTDPLDLRNANIFIITVPTPVDHVNRPDISLLLRASEQVGSVLKNNDIVIYESTVYPGVTEEECVPVLEKFSNKIFNKDFFVGYSPERINPGDKSRTLTKIRKVTSGSTPMTAIIVDKLYSSIIHAGTYMASSIKVAEAAKVIENSQRDINIAFINELSKIFNLLGIDTNDVLDAASTKWNFLNFRPGLVGGHCIGVDPYYLAQKAQEVGYHPEIILAGRRVNDSMGKYVATEVLKLMLQKKLLINTPSVLILGFTFKENCPDIRNTRVIDIYQELVYFGLNVDIYDPLAKVEDSISNYGIEISNVKPNKKYSAVVLAVSHTDFLNMDIMSFLGSEGIIYDVKGVLSREIAHSRL